MQKKYLSQLPIVRREVINSGHFRLVLKVDQGNIDVRPGQFVEIRVSGADGVLLRRPISVNDFNAQKGELSLLIHEVGAGTQQMAKFQVGSSVDIIFPLGNGFDLDEAGDAPLLVGGGVGVAPLLFLGKELVKRGAKPTFLFGARTANALLCLDEFRAVAPVIFTTEDGSDGTKGFVTDHAALKEDAEANKFTSIMQCGPTPMMKAVGKRAQALNIKCFASLENMMACGFGVCLCCVTDTIAGNIRVCADGPVFNVNDLKW